MTPEQYHMGRVAQTGCIVCRRLGCGYVPGQVHHIAPASSPRSDFSVANLCPEHHTGGAGLHKLHSRFMKLFRVPFEVELGMLVWQNEDLTLLAMGRLRTA